MKRIFKQSLSWMLCLAMIFSTMPIGYAEDNIGDVGAGEQVVESIDSHESDSASESIEAQETDVTSEDGEAQETDGAADAAESDKDAEASEGLENQGSEAENQNEGGGRTTKK